MISTRTGALLVVLLIAVACSPNASAPPSTLTAVVSQPSSGGQAALATAAATAAIATIPSPSPIVNSVAVPTATPIVGGSAPSSTTTPVIVPTATVATPSTAPASQSSQVPRVTTVFGGLEIPWAIDFAADGRWFFTERPGRIRIVVNGVLKPEPWLTLSVAAQPGQESGLLGFALDPSFATNHFAYTYYTYTDGGGMWNRVVRLREVGGQGVVDRVLIDRIAGAGIHDGGRLRFGPDGKLYVTTGDAGDGNRAQDLSSLNGKILRLNPDGSIPSDNPFPGSFVYSYGHRNPEGLAWLPGTNTLYSSEHGPSSAPPFCCHDEINIIQPGVNYGWPAVYGIVHDARFRDPILESGLDTWAPSGATFDPRADHRGTLWVATLRSQSLKQILVGNGTTSPSVTTLLDHQFGRLRDVEVGPDGALYVLTSNRDGRGSPAGSDDRILRLTFG